MMTSEEEKLESIFGSKKESEIKCNIINVTYIVGDRVITPDGEGTIEILEPYHIKRYGVKIGDTIKYYFEKEINDKILQYPKPKNNDK